ncbi:hypothetical protein QEN19_003132 [Hanseniaspora menglaensis]
MNFGDRNKKQNGKHKFHETPTHSRLDNVHDNLNNNVLFLGNKNHRIVNPLIQNMNFSRHNSSQRTPSSTRSPLPITNQFSNDDIFIDEGDVMNEFEDDSIFGDSSNFYAHNNWGSNSSLESLNLILEKQRKQQLNNPFHQTHIFLPTKIKIEYDPITKKTMLNHYEIIKEMGTGQFGKVKLVRNMYTEELMAMKIVNRNSSSLTKKMLSKNIIKDESEDNAKLDCTDQTTLLDNVRNDAEYSVNLALHHGIEDSKIRREITIMKRLKNKNIIKLIEVLNDPESQKIYLILEYCAQGEIKWCPGNQLEINAKGPPLLSFSKTRDYFRQIILGLEYLQHHNIVHRDLKPANLLLTENDVVKISDFGCSLFLNSSSEEELVKTVGTPVFYAPEICVTNATEFYKKDSIRQIISFPLDIWALGVTLFCFLFGKLPFNSKHEMDLFDIICNGRLDFPLNTPNIEIREYHQSQNLLLRLLDKNPFKRITIEEIKIHPFTIGDLTKEQQLAFVNTHFENADDFEDDNNLEFGYDSNRNILVKNNFDSNSNRFVSLPINSSFASLDSFYIDNHAHLATDNRNLQKMDTVGEKAINISNGIGINLSNRKLSIASSKDMQIPKYFGSKFNKRIQKKALDLNTDNPKYSLPRSHYLPQNSSLDSSNRNGKSNNKHWKDYYDDSEDEEEDQSEFGYNYQFNSGNAAEEVSDTESLPFEFKEDSDNEDDFEKINNKLDILDSSENSTGNKDSHIYLVDALTTSRDMNDQFHKINDEHSQVPKHTRGNRHGNLIFVNSSDDSEEENEEAVVGERGINLMSVYPKNVHEISNTNSRSILQLQDQNHNRPSVADIQGIKQVAIPESILMQMQGGSGILTNHSDADTKNFPAVAKRIYSMAEVEPKIFSNKNTTANYGIGQPTTNGIHPIVDSILQNKQTNILKSTTQVTNTVASTHTHDRSFLNVNQDFDTMKNGESSENSPTDQKYNFKSVNLLQSFINKK